MKLKKIAKLQIARETLRNLDEKSLGAAGGGTGSLTSGTVFDGGCCVGCGCIHTETACDGRTGAASCLCPDVKD